MIIFQKKQDITEMYIKNTYIWPCVLNSLHLFYITQIDNSTRHIGIKMVITLKILTLSIHTYTFSERKFHEDSKNDIKNEVGWTVHILWVKMFDTLGPPMYLISNIHIFFSLPIPLIAFQIYNLNGFVHFIEIILICKFM